MTLADLDRSGTVASRLPLVILLCAIALGIVGMHGLAFEPEPAGHVGNHAGQVVTVTADSALGADASGGAVAGEEAPPIDHAGILALCLMVLTPGVAVGLWMLVTARVGGWRLPRLVARFTAAVDVAVLPPPFRRQLTVLRI